MSLIEANWCPQATVILHNGKTISNKKKAELKAIFLEGLIRFLEIYVQTEIGEGIEIDITKVALHINSAQFENDDLYSIKSIDDVYQLLETLTISGLPIWRFLQLSKYQNKIFESGYDELLISAKKMAASERPCYGCIWYSETDTFLGELRRCNRPEVEWTGRRNGYHDPDEIKECKWLTTLDRIPDALYLEEIPEIRRKKFLQRVDDGREKFNESLSKDPFRIPKTLSEEDKVDLSKKYDWLDDLGCAWNNKRTKTERQSELRKAMYIEGMIRFFEIYAKCEIGNKYISDIKNIALFIDKMESDEINYIESFDELYRDLEEKIINGLDVKKFVKFDEGEVK